MTNQAFSLDFTAEVYLSAGRLLFALNRFITLTAYSELFLCFKFILGCHDAVQA